jgi:hypothetical protein
MLRPTLALAALALTAAPAAAANYSATLATPTSARIIAQDIVWNCGPAACQGATEESRPVVLCQSLARRTGHVESFLVDGRALSERELASCNAAAKTQAAKALAAQ